jgi:hypothetical protein
MYENDEPGHQLNMSLSTVVLSPPLYLRCDEVIMETLDSKKSAQSLEQL